MIFVYSARRVSPPRLLALKKLALLGSTLALTALTNAASASPALKTLHSFCKKGDFCTDGSVPSSPLLRDTAGNLYGITRPGGGKFGLGSVFEISADGAMHTLHSFGSRTDARDGNGPFGALIIDVNGNLYGTTQSGGAADRGSVYKLIPDADRTKWKLVTLYSFCPGSDCSRDGDEPIGGVTYLGANAGVPYDGTSPLYGATFYGGTSGSGTVYRLTISAGKAHEDIVYNFCTVAYCSDGDNPIASLAIDGAGNLYGSTLGGGATSNGVTFQLSPDFKETPLHSFCALDNCADGNVPGALAIAADGRLYGTTQAGGPQDAGIVFRIAPNGKHSKFTILYTFCSQDSCADGSVPTRWPLTIDPNGNLFGTTTAGGSQGFGTVFKLHGTTETVLYNFCSQLSCADGAKPNSGVILDSSGNFYGTTDYGGKHGDSISGGTVFELTP